MTKTVFISRDLDEYSAFTALLHAAGWQVRGLSLVTLTALPFDEIPEVDWIFFASKNAVRFFFGDIAAGRNPTPDPFSEGAGPISSSIIPLTRGVILSESEESEAEGLKNKIKSRPSASDSSLSLRMTTLGMAIKTELVGLTPKGRGLDFVFILRHSPPLHNQFSCNSPIIRLQAHPVQPFRQPADIDFFLVPAGRHKRR